VWFINFRRSGSGRRVQSGSVSGRAGLVWWCRRRIVRRLGDGACGRGQAVGAPVGPVRVSRRPVS